MDRLFTKCVKEAIHTVSVDSFATTLNIFDKYQIEDGYNVFVEFAKENKEQLERAADYDKISHSFKCTVSNAA